MVAIVLFQGLCLHLKIILGFCISRHITLLFQVIFTDALSLQHSRRTSGHLLYVLTKEEKWGLPVWSVAMSSRHSLHAWDGS